MIKQAEVQVGDRVHFQPEYLLKEGKWENGVVKEIPEDYTSYVRVVYKCNDDWDNYQEYTGVLTHCRDLHLDWKENN